MRTKAQSVGPPTLASVLRGRVAQLSRLGWLWRAQHEHHERARLLALCEVPRHDVGRVGGTDTCSLSASCHRIQPVKPPLVTMFEPAPLRPYWLDPAE